jgi:hypothetical protein
VPAFEDVASDGLPPVVAELAVSALEDDPAGSEVPGIDSLPVDAGFLANIPEFHR